MSLDLAPVTYIATEASTAVAMHATKAIIYRHFVAFDAHAWRLAALLSLGMVMGSWIGKRTVERLSVERFRTVVGILLALMGAQMVVFG